MQEEIAALKHEHEKSIEDMKANITEKDASVEEKNQALEGKKTAHRCIEAEGREITVAVLVHYVTARNQLSNLYDGIPCSQ